MKYLGILLIASVSISLTCSRTYTDYCSVNLCPKGVKHIGCNFDSMKWRNLPPFFTTAYVDEITTDTKDFILYLHNSYRNQIASGNEHGYNAACRMATMRWDNQLAELAEYNIRQFKSQRDDCHNTEKFGLSGQNRGLILRFNSSYAEFGWEDLFDIWYSGIKLYNPNLIENYRPGPVKIRSEFTLMVTDRNTHVGCASATVNKRKTIHHIITCNYATDNVVGKPVYRSCQKPVERCEKGPNPQFQNLCNINEQIDPNKY